MPRKYIPNAPQKCKTCNKKDCEFSLNEYTGEKIARECKTYYDLFLELEDRTKLVQPKHDGDKYEQNLMGPAIVAIIYASKANKIANQANLYARTELKNSIDSQVQTKNTELFEKRLNILKIIDQVEIWMWWGDIWNQPPSWTVLFFYLHCIGDMV